MIELTYGVIMMKFSICDIEHGERWGLECRDMDIASLEDIIDLIKCEQVKGKYVFRFIIYDPPKVPYEAYTGSYHIL